MFNVIRKDLLLNRRSLLGLALVQAGFLAFLASEAGRSAPVYVTLGGLFFMPLSLGPVLREEKFGALALGCSLPVSRRTVVAARYMFNLGAALAGVVIALGLGTLLPFSRVPIDRLWSADALLAAVTVVTLAMALLLPFVVRFGAAGFTVAMVGLLVLGLVVAPIARLTGAAPALRSAARQAVAVIGAVHAGFGMPGVVAVAGVLLVAALAVSFWLSLRAFERRDL